MELSRRDSLIIKTSLTTFTLIVVGCFIAIAVLTSTGNKTAVWFPLAICAVVLFGLVGRLSYLYWTTIRKQPNQHVAEETSQQPSTGQVFSVTPTNRPGETDLALSCFEDTDNFELLSGIPIIGLRGTDPHTQFQFQLIQNISPDRPPNYISATTPVYEEPPPNYEEALSKSP